MRPVFRLTADGEDVTAGIADRLIQLTLADEAGLEADTLDITLDDRGAALAIPRHGAALELSLGLGARLVAMGRWVVNRTEIAGLDLRLRIGATAADMAGPIRAPRTRLWEDTTLGDMTRAIAAEAGLSAVVAPALDGMRMTEAQTAESDLHLLTRISRRIGALVKPAAGRLIVTRRGAPETADGTAIAAAPVALADLSRWTLRSEDRGSYGSVEAVWRDLGDGTQSVLVVGSGDPRRRLRHVYPTEAQAREAAEAALADAARGGQSGSLEFASFRPELFAGARLALPFTRAPLAGDWLVTRCEHRLVDGLTTSVELERPEAAG
jgi:phage protein D